jgi:2-polyprenyl-3-methyl-5-hydroxy-6-metoxy-1,4-benzoquinol methylase
MNKRKISRKFHDPILSDNRNWRKDIPEYDSYFISTEKELQGLPKEGGVVVDPSIVVNVNCAVCGDSEHKQVLCKYGFLYVECSYCGHIYVYNRLLSEKIISDYKGESKIEEISHKIEQSSRLKSYANGMYSKYLALFSELGINNGSLLDIGCGAGNFIDYCKKNSPYDIYANEINENMYPNLRKIVGNNLITGAIEEQVDLKEKFNIITLWGVLEHLIDPSAVLTTVKTLLSDNGYILALVPNIHSRAYKLLGARTPTLNPKVHLQMFSENSFRLMCNNSGLQVVEMFGELPVIDLMYEYIKYNDDLVSEIMDCHESYYHVYLLESL